MAINFEKKEWVDREVQHPNRRRQIPTELDGVYEYERVEGEVYEIGNAFDAKNMNDLEDRIANGLDNIDDTNINVTDPEGKFVGGKLNDVLYELFQYAFNGKTAIATAIKGISVSSTFTALANAITNGKTAIANAIGSGSSNDTFSTLASFITALKNNYQTTINQLNGTITARNNTITSLNNEISSGKSVISGAIGKTPGGTPNSNDSFATLANYISSYKKNVINDNGNNPLMEPIVIFAFSINGETYTQDIVYDFGFKPSFIMLYKKDSSVYESSPQVLMYNLTDVNSDFPTFGIDRVTEHGFRFWAKCGPGYRMEMGSVINSMNSHFSILAIG